MTHDTRDEVVDYVRRWSQRTELSAKRLVQWIGLGMSKYYDWVQRYGQVNEHNGLVPRDHWLEAWERDAIAAFHREHPLEGYRRLTYMLMDADLVAASPAVLPQLKLEFSGAGVSIMPNAGELDECFSERSIWQRLAAA